MNKPRAFCSLMICIISLFILNTTLLAESKLFQTSAIQADTSLFLENICLTPLSNEPAKEPVRFMAVSDSGILALGTNDAIEKIIYIYSSDGDFLAGYTFRSTGDYCMEWQGDTLLICFVRDMEAIALSLNGDPLLLSIPNNSHNTGHLNDLMHMKNCIVNDIEYSFKEAQGLIPTSYRDVIKTDSNGNQQILYTADQSEALPCANIIITLLVSTSIIVAILVVLLLFKHRQHPN